MKFNLRRCVAYAAIALAAVIAVPGELSAAVIDSFSAASASPGGLSPGVTIFSPPGNAATLDTGLGATAFGGSRTGAFTLVGANGASSGVALVGAGIFAYNHGGIGTSQLSLSYSSAPTDFSNASGIDLGILSMDAAALTGTTFQFTLNDGTSLHTFSQLVTSLAVNPVPFLFSSFSDFGNLNLASIIGVQLDITVPNDGDVRLDFIETREIPPVPEPASIAVWSVLAMAGYGARRKLARAKA